MSISNERLEELESKCTDYLAWLAKHSATHDEDTADFLSVITELKSYRQAATAGVEEAAERILKLTEPFIQTSASLPAMNLDRQGTLALIASELTALLAERDAKIAVLEARLAVLGKVEEMLPRQFFNLIVSPLHDGGFDVSLYNWDAEVEERGCEGKTLLEAFTALVDGKEGG